MKIRQDIRDNKLYCVLRFKQQGKNIFSDRLVCVQVDKSGKIKDKSKKPDLIPNNHLKYFVPFNF